jgi:hypothetical protein
LKPFYYLLKQEGVQVGVMESKNRKKGPLLQFAEKAFPENIGWAEEDFKNLILLINLSLPGSFWGKSIRQINQSF